MNTMLAILALPVLEAVVVGALAGLVGALAVLDRRVFFAESITHGTFPGAVLGVVVASAAGWGHGAMSLSLFAGALLMCLPLAALMYALTRIPGVSSQASAGVVLTLGFASGYFLATWFKPLPLQVSSFLAGSILTVSGADLAAASACLALALGLMGARGPQLMRHCFDPVGLSPRTRRTNELAILTVLLLTVVVLIPAIGTVLSIALIAAPAAALRPHAPTLRAFMVAAPVLGALIALSGLALAVAADWSAGGCIALVAGLVTAASALRARLGAAPVGR